jgi:hypothetical protein
MCQFRGRQSLLLLLLLFKLQMGFYPVALVLQWDNTQITHITQNNTPHSNKTAHKSTQTIKDTPHTIKQQIQLQL